MPGVMVWRIALDPVAPPDASALAELAPNERARAQRFATDPLRNRWLAAHVAMRRILAATLNLPPAELRYGTAEAGKPFLAAPGGTGLEFNLSDSGDLALLAVSRCGPVGVDVEWCREGRDLPEIAESFFAQEELASLSALKDAEQPGAFYRIWARKEAFIKAIGLGLQFDLKRFAVSGEPENPRFLRLDADERTPGTWRLWNVPVPNGYAGALVTRPDAAPVGFSDWDSNS